MNLTTDLKANALVRAQNLSPRLPSSSIRMNNMRSKDTTDYLSPDVIDKCRNLEGAILHLAIDKQSEVMNEAAQKGITSEMFALPEHMTIWNILEKAYQEGKKMDVSLLVHELSSISSDKIRDAAIDALMNIRTIEANPEMTSEYFDELRKAQIGRATDYAICLWKQEGNTAEASQNLISRLYHLQNQSSIISPVSVEDGLGSVIKDLCQQNELGTHIKGTKTGYPLLDVAVGGMSAGGGYYLVAGRPGAGKTSFGINVAYNVAMSARGSEGKVLFVSGEMSPKAVYQRLLSIASQMSWKELCLATKEQLDNLEDIIRGLAQCNMSIIPADGNVEMTANMIRAICQREKVLLVVVDYLQLFHSDVAVKGNRVDDLEKVSAVYRELAKAIDAPILALAQLNRSVDKIGDKPPCMADLKGSGALEQDAQAVMLIHHKLGYGRDEASIGSQVELILAKNRDGETGTIPFCWEGRTQTFREEKVD